MLWVLFSLPSRCLSFPTFPRTRLQERHLGELGEDCSPGTQSAPNPSVEERGRFCLLCGSNSRLCLLLPRGPQIPCRVSPGRPPPGPAGDARVLVGRRPLTSRGGSPPEAHLQRPQEVPAQSLAVLLQGRCRLRVRRPPARGEWQEIAHFPRSRALGSWRARSPCTLSAHSPLALGDPAPLPTRAHTHFYF